MRNVILIILTRKCRLWDLETPTTIRRFRCLVLKGEEEEENAEADPSISLSLRQYGPKRKSKNNWDVSWNSSGLLLTVSRLTALGPPSFAFARLSALSRGQIPFATRVACNVITHALPHTDTLTHTYTRTSLECHVLSLVVYPLSRTFDLLGRWEMPSKINRLTSADLLRLPCLPTLPLYPRSPLVPFFSLQQLEVRSPFMLITKATTATTTTTIEQRQQQQAICKCNLNPAQRIPFAILPATCHTPLAVVPHAACHILSMLVLTLIRMLGIE